MNRRIFLLAFGTFATGTNTFVIVGILPQIARELDAPISLVGLSAGATAVAYAISAPLLPALLSRFSHRTILAISLTSFIAILAATTLVDDAYSFLAMRALVGLAAAGFTPQASAVAFSLVAPRHRGRAISAVLLGLVLATAVSAPIGTLIGNTWGYRATLWYVALLGLVALVALIWVPQQRRVRSVTGMRHRLRPLRRPAVVAIAGTTALISAGNATVYVFFAPLLSATAGLNPSEIAIALGIYGAAGIVAIIIVGRLIDRLGGFKVTLIAVVGMIVTSLAFPIAPQLIAAGVVVLVWGVFSDLYGAAQQYELGLLEDEDPAPVFAINTSSLFVGTALGTGLGSLVLQFGEPALLPVAACAPLTLAAAATVSSILRKRSKRVKIVETSTRVDNEGTPRGSKEIGMATSAERGSVIVVGSVNQDLFRYVDSLPQAGETVFATGVAAALGGKGANQAVASRLVGSDVVFVGAVGADQAGTDARSALERVGISTTHLATVDTAGTGTALIIVDRAGENTIVVDSGANRAVSPETAAEVVRELAGRGSSVVLCQGELPATVVDAVAEAARATGSRFVLNLAPVIDVATTTLAHAYPLIVNEVEADRLVGTTVQDAAAELHARYGGAVVVTLGARGARLIDDGVDTLIAGSKVDAVDTTGAGDAFTGVLASALARGMRLEEAVRFGVAAGGIAVGAHGTAASYPRAADLIGWDQADEQGAA
jgi:ribokinase